ncbi:MAG: hypothetical protein Q7T07_05455 [Burkholderiaceae bacterium]|nr:hypothetical protein [Burkholderiaceae bacterium]
MMVPIKNVATLAMVALIAGCGGGGGSPAVDTSSLSIQGGAIKGPMSQAKISLYKVTADGKQGDLLQETTSDQNGQYSVTVNGYSGVVIMVASVVSGTTMYDEATGKTIVPATNFWMRASFAAEAGKTYSAQINPLTDLATATALSKTGGLTSTNVAQANKDLAESLTFDPLTSKPEFDATTKAPKNAAAAMLAAVSRMAESGALGCSAGEQAAKVACVTQALSEKGLTDAGVKASLQTYTNAMAFEAGLPAVTITDPSGTAPSTTSPVEQTKAFFGTLRSNAKALDATDLSLQTELQAVSDDMTGRTIPIASTSVDALNLARLGVQLWNDVIKNDSAAFVQGKTFYGKSFNNDASYFYGAPPIGGCSFYSDPGYDFLATSKAEAKYVACGTQAQVVQAPTSCVNLGDVCNTSWSTRVRLHPDAVDASKFTVYSQTRAATIKKQTAYLYASSTPYYKYYNPSIMQYRVDPVCPAGASCTVVYPDSADVVCPPGKTCTTTVLQLEDKGLRKQYGAAFPGNAATLVSQRDSGGKITAVNLVGELSPGYEIGHGSSYFDSSRSMWVNVPPVVTVLGDKHNIALSAALSKVGDLDKLAVSGSIDLVKNGALETRMELIDGSYLQAKLDQGSYSAQNGSQEMLLKLKASTAGSAVSGDVKLSAFKLDASSTSYIPTLVSFAGSVERKGVSFFEGTLTGEALNHASFKSNDPRSGANVQKVRIGFTGKVAIPTRPTLNVNLSVVNNNTGSSATSTATLGGQYSQGAIVINLAGQTSAASNVLTLTSSEGIQLVIDKSKTSYPLTKNGALVGQYATSSNRINYTDNSYEQY